MSARCDVLVVIAHPDDEIFVSGTLCLCAEKGFIITIVCVSDGEGGSRELLFALPEVRLSDVRRRELQLSAWALGVRDVVFLGWPDVASPDHGPDAWGRTTLIGALAEIIRDRTPQLVLTHGPLGGYGHAAHRLVSHCVMAAVHDVHFPGSVFSFCGQIRRAFFSWHFDQPSDVLVDARQYLRRRAASLAYHQSQVDFFLQPYVPKTLRKVASASFGYAFAFTEAGRKRVPIATPTRFFSKLRVEGLVRQKPPTAGPDFFAEHYGNDGRVQIGR